MFSCSPSHPPAGNHHSLTSTRSKSKLLYKTQAKKGGTRSITPTVPPTYLWISSSSTHCTFMIGGSKLFVCRPAAPAVARQTTSMKKLDMKIHRVDPPRQHRHTCSLHVRMEYLHTYLLPNFSSGFTSGGFSACPGDDYSKILQLSGNPCCSKCQRWSIWDR